MINPNGQPNVTFTKSAMTRSNNTRIDAARRSMPFNQAAQQSLRNQTNAKVSTGQPPVGPYQSNPLQGLEPSMPVQVPTGGPQAPVSMAQDFDPAVFAEQALDSIVEDIKTQQFMESPRVKDGMEAVRFKNLMNRDNVKYQPDQRTLFEQVVSRIGMNK